MSSYKSVFIFSTLLIFTNFAHATQYQIIDLTPTGYTSSYANGLGDGIQVGVVANQNIGYSVAWYGSKSSYVQFSQPTNFDGVNVLIASGSRQAGYGYPTNIPPTLTTIVHALLWNGPSSTANDLNPTGFYSSQILAMDNNQQVGFAALETSQNNRRAMLWSGTSGSAIDLHSSSFQNTEVWGVGGGQQVGDSYDSPHNNLHALMWSGSASSIVDLTPTGAHGAAYGSDGVHQGGVINSHAAFWSGSAATYQDFNPSGYSSSAIYQMLPGVQVGGATSIATGQRHAAVWNGTLGSFQDINPAGYTYSVANQINSQGWIIGTANDGNNFHAIIWKPVPEPGSIAALTIGLVGVVLRNRKRI